MKSNGESVSPSPCIIRKYSNRRFYAVDFKRYVTLRDIASLIEEGKEVRVYDYSSKEDITSSVLAQIIYIKEKERAGYTGIGTDLMRRIMKERDLTEKTKQLLNIVSNYLHEGRNPLIQVRGEVKRFFESLIKKGEISLSELKKGISLLVELTGEKGGYDRSIQDKVSKILDIATPLNKLKKELKSVEDRLSELEKGFKEMMKWKVKEKARKRKR